MGGTELNGLAAHLGRNEGRPAWSLEQAIRREERLRAAASECRTLGKAGIAEGFENVIVLSDEFYEVRRSIPLE